jgi:hypothetical protein
LMILVPSGGETRAARYLPFKRKVSEKEQNVERVDDECTNRTEQDEIFRSAERGMEQP